MEMEDEIKELSSSVLQDSKLWDRISPNPGSMTTSRE